MFVCWKYIICAFGLLLYYYCFKSGAYWGLIELLLFLSLHQLGTSQWQHSFWRFTGTPNGVSIHIFIYYLSTIYVFVYIYSRVGGILERIQYMGACLIALKVFFHPCNNPRFTRIVTWVTENLEGNSASSHVYIIQPTI